MSSVISKGISSKLKKADVEQSALDGTHIPTQSVDDTTKGRLLTVGDTGEQLGILARDITLSNIVAPTIDLDFTKNESTIYDGAENSFVKKSVTQAVTDGDLTVSNGASNVYDARGRLAPVSANKPRFTFNAETGEAEGLLVEEARTNLVANGYSTYDYNGGCELIGFGESPSGSMDAVLVTGANTSANSSGEDNLRIITALPASDIILSSSVYVYSPSGADVGLRQAANASKQYASEDGIFGKYTRLTVSDTVSTTTSIFILYSSDGSPFYVWHPQLEKGSFPTSPIPEASTYVSGGDNGSYYDSTGTLQTNVTGQARYTYNPADLTAPPVLVDEVERTNSLFPSDMSTHTDLGYTRTTTVGLDGISDSALRLQEDTGNSQRRLRDTTRNDLTLDVGGTITHSVFVKPDANRGNIALVTESNNDVLTIIEFDVFGGEVVDITANDCTYLSGRVQNIGDGWYRLSYTVELTAAITEAGCWLFFSNTNGNGNATYTGDGSSSVTVYGMQLEQGSYPTSYIPTTDTAVTRTSDNVTYSQATRVADGVYRDLTGYEFGDEFSWYVDVVLNDFGGVVGGVGDTFNDCFYITNTGVTVRVGGVSQSGSISLSTKTRYKIIVTISGSTVKIYVNGVLELTLAAAGFLSKSIRSKVLSAPWEITSSNANTNCGIVFSHKIYPKALSEAECLALTGGA